MNKDVFQGSWSQVKGKLKSVWGELTDDELAEAKGDVERLSGRIQQKYGLTKEQVRAELRRMGVID
ncbi:MAG: CsbD family protein [Candidatus Hydrogenedentota bacterium]